MPQKKKEEHRTTKKPLQLVAGLLFSTCCQSIQGLLGETYWRCSFCGSQSVSTRVICRVVTQNCFGRWIAHFTGKNGRQLLRFAKCFAFSVLLDLAVREPDLLQQLTQNHVLSLSQGQGACGVDVSQRNARLHQLTSFNNKGLSLETVFKRKNDSLSTV